MISVESLANTLLESIRNSDNKTSAYDTTATVSRVEGDTAWVHIDGGVDETPVKLTIAANVGDDVQVRVSGGRAFMVGNASAPPTDDTTAIIAQTTASVAIEDSARAKEAADNAEASAVAAQEAATQAVTDAGIAGRAASVAQTAAEAAQATADTKKTVFITQPTPPYHVGDLWAKLGDDLRDMITSEGDNLVDSAGDLFQAAILTQGTIYVCTVPKLAGQTFAESDWELATADEGLREWFWHDANGAHILGDETGYRNDITSTGMKIINTSTEKSVAEFGSNGAQIGQSETAHLDIQSDGLSGYGSDGATYFDFSSSDANVPAETVYGMPSEIRNATITYSQGRRKQFGSTITITDWGEESGDICTIISSSLRCSALNNDYSFRGTSSHTNCSAVPLSGGFKIVLEPFDITIGTNSTHTATTTVILKNNGTNYQFLFEFNYTYAYSNGVSSISYECYVTSKSPSSPTLTCKQHYASGRLVREISVVAPYMRFGSRPLDEVAGGYSATLGQNLYGSSNYQTAIGKYNVQDSADAYAFIIGNGTADDERSNALTVGWNGNVTASGNITDGSGNTLSTIASATNSKLKNITVKGISKSFYISAGTSSTPTTKDITFTSTELDGGSIYNAYVCLGTYQLPYFNVANNRFTWLSSVTSDTLTISNSATAWGSSSNPYTAYCVLFLTGTT